MRRTSLYENYLRSQREALIISMLMISATIGCVVVAYRNYQESTRISYLHHQGVTLQILRDHSEIFETQPKLSHHERTH
jgi:hypothetical protein